MADEATFFHIKDLKRLIKSSTWKKSQDECNSQELFVKNIEQSNTWVPSRWATPPAM